MGKPSVAENCSEVRTSENKKIIIAEKMSVIAHLANGYTCVQEDLDEAWRTLMLAQHHDSWIVPYNGLNKFGTWADQIKRWTDETNTVADKITAASIFSFDNDTINTEKPRDLYVFIIHWEQKRKELVTVELPQEYADFDLEVNDYRNKKLIIQ